MGLIDLLPAYYTNSTQVVKLQGAFETQVEALQAANDDLFMQLLVESATWGLSLWETVLGLTIDLTKSNEYRRSRILSKLRGKCTTTKAMIQNVAKSFSNGDVDIVEDNTDYQFTVKFVGTMGIPPNMDDLTAAIEDIKPAHLAFIFEYTYITWAEFDSYNKTWDQWDTFNLTWNQFEEYRE